MKVKSITIEIPASEPNELPFQITNLDADGEPYANGYLRFYHPDNGDESGTAVTVKDLENILAAARHITESVMPKELK